ncbi:MULTISPECIES: hypothetical protein [unclassified Pseudomonas]|uniref:hypothetical protein n=1 Tax=unclassified Pseudomonas TaxID=196821 RepID=UPI0021C86010|nr:MULTISPECIES: hypothetical protein [unclassified Pseudomonas]MCU1733366.1 hypothetical protein [Pseudomonas sp. 20P_3.2_Bac4]MCU1743929.1 hypothetical protein [Pseudomonas sp. 20P_3.2_Bac5]
MSSGGGSSPTPNRTCTGNLKTDVRLVLVYQPAYSLNGANWNTTPATQVAANTSPVSVFIANGQTPDGRITYQADDGTQFVLAFTMNGTNAINVIGNGGGASAYNYSVASPGTGDTITAVYTISRSNSQ